MSIDTALSRIGQIISMEQQLCSPAGVASASSATAGASASGAIRFQVSLSAVLHAGGYLSQPADTRTLRASPGWSRVPANT